MKKLLVLSVCALLIGCQPRIDTRGNLTVKDYVDTFVVGKTTMHDILEKCGTPSLHSDDFTWIYIGANAEETSFSDVKLTNKSIIKLHFNQNKTLKAIEKIDNNNSIIMDKEISELPSEKQIEKKLKK